MVCSPNSNQLNPPILGPAPNLGFGPMFAPFNLPFPDISLPDGIPDDILALLEQLYALIPGGKLVPNAGDTFRTLFDAIASVLNQLAPYLALYNFFQALLNMILCIIDVLCSFKLGVPRAIRRLFKKCLPDFLNLFPIMALIAMILALILLLLALIEYLIQLILAYIRDIIANLLILAEAVQFDSEQDVLAGVQKIASLLCLIEQAFALLIAFQAIFAIIQALANLGARSVCSKRNRRGDDGDCCPDEYCPPFIAENPDGLFGTMGRLVYHRTVEYNTSSFGSINVPPLRTERWQFVDDEESLQYKLGDIITPIKGNIYWPTPLEYKKDSSLKKVPYTLDLRMFIDPTDYEHPEDNGEFSGPRHFRIKDVIVEKQPYFGVLNYQNKVLTNNVTLIGDIEIPSIGNNTGTLSLVGGLVFEDDGVTPLLIDGVQLSLDTFITKEQTFINPNSEDGYQVTDISYNLKINHDELYNQSIITAGCLPDVSEETDAFNNQVPNIDPIISRIGSLPDFDGALQCLNESLNKFRNNVSVENAAVFESEVVGCLNNLKDQAQNTYKNALTEGVSVYESDVELDPEIQFIDEAIKVKVTLKDPGGNIISFNVPEESRDEIASKIAVIPTLGNVSDFEFNGENAFVADLRSERPGDGSLKVYFNGAVFSRILNRDDDELPTITEERVFNYKFVGTGFKASGEDDAKERRDEGDVSIGSGGN